MLAQVLKPSIWRGLSQSLPFSALAGAKAAAAKAQTSTLMTAKGFMTSSLNCCLAASLEARDARFNLFCRGSAIRGALISAMANPTGKILALAGGVGGAKLALG